MAFRAFTAGKQLLGNPLRPSTSIQRFARLQPTTSASLRLPTRIPPHQIRTAFGRPRYRYDRFSNAQGWAYRWHSSPVFRYVVYTAGAGGITFYITNLETVPISGRRRFNFISPQLEKELAMQGYPQLLEQFKGKILPQSHPYTQMVKKVMRRLVAAAGLENEDWEIRIVDEPNTPNAMVMPGGKVFVFTGILPICANEDGLATVLSHEVSHVLAHHPAEAMSSEVWYMAFIFLLATVFDYSGYSASLFTDLLFRKTHSRKAESEADHIGLLMMAKACYDPSEGTRFWDRMTKQEQLKGGSVPAFLSTHPASSQRIANLNRWLPEAKDKREQSNCANLSDYTEQFNRSVSDRLVGANPRRSQRPNPNNNKSDDGYFF